MSCPAALVYRNYFYGGQGQGGEGKQIDNFADAGEVLQNGSGRFWRMQNGYLKEAQPDAVRSLGDRIAADESLRHRVVESVRVGVHWDTDVITKEAGSVPTNVCQVYASALPVSYNR